MQLKDSGALARAGRSPQPGRLQRVSSFTTTAADCALRWDLPAAICLRGSPRLSEVSGGVLLLIPGDASERWRRDSLAWPSSPPRRKTGRRLHFAIAGPGFHVVLRIRCRTVAQVLPVFLRGGPAAAQGHKKTHCRSLSSGFSFGSAYPLRMQAFFVAICPWRPRRSRVEWGFKESADALNPSGCCAAVPIIVLVSTNHCAITVIEVLFNSLSVQQDVGFKANMLRRMHCGPGSSRLEKACQPRPPRARNRHRRTRIPASPPHPQAKPH